MQRFTRTTPTLARREPPRSSSNTEHRRAVRSGLRVAILGGLLAWAATGCKLVELKMPGEPLTKRDLGLRVQTREFAAIAAATIEQAADRIERESKDPAAQANATRWKIGAIGSLRKATLRTTPTLGLVDAWAFSRQLSEFFAEGAGRDAFGPWQGLAVTNCQSLEVRIGAVAQTLLSASDAKRMREFVEAHSREFPLKGFSFDREAVVARWQDARGQVESPPAGTTSEALTDLADRLQIVAQQVPDEVRWRVGLESRDLEAAMARTGATMDRLDAALKLIGGAAASSPAIVSNGVHELRVGFLPILERFDKQWGTTLGALQQEREALTKTLASEREAVLKSVDQQRIALTQTVDQQRGAIMQDVQKLTTEVVDRSMQQFRALTRDVLFYVVLLVAVILGIPFLLGVWVGKISAKLKRPAGG
ncbi:MAG: hypothetical protein HYR88_14700 [Verrucomicrobia bacterium]|nr:hypothetical protein [Verrucomicrobiota bacterium]MBI3866946.1 hypothetical protein [Verrucomicrobiota bacterium]